MCFFYRCRGSISLMLLIILLPMLTFAGLMIDISNHHLAKAAAEGAGELALNTALADYDTVLKETYGLFAMSQQSTSRQDEFNMRLLDHFESALQSSGLQNISIESFNASAVPESSLANPEILEKGIIEFMKYRGPAEAGLSLLDSLEVFDKLDDRTAVADKKIAVEARLGDLSVSCTEFLEAISKYDELQSDFINKEQSLIAQINNLTGIEDPESEEYREACDAAEEEFSRLCLESPEDIIDYAISLGDGIKEGISEAAAANTIFESAQASYKEALGGDEDSFYLAMREESDKYAARFSAGDVDEIIEQLKAAGRYLQARKSGGLDSYLNSPDNLKPGIISDEIYLKPISGLINVNGTTIGIPSFYVYLISTYGVKSEAGDSELGDGSILKENVSIINDQAKDGASVDKAFSYALELFENTPSGSDFADPEIFKTVDKREATGAADQFGNMSSAVSEMLALLKEGVEDLRDSMYITEYAINNFSYLTTDADQMTMSGVPVDPEHNRIYGCEVEYIIFGTKGCEEEKFLWFTTKEASGPEVNIATAKTYIFALRFAFNSMFALTDASIDQMTLAPAMSIQAASGGVFPYQLAQLTLKLALAMAESASDLKTLADGGRVPLMKTASTWRFSAGGMIDALRAKVTDEIAGAAKSAFDKGTGMLQDLVDGAVSTVDMSAEEVINGLSQDIETALNSYLQEAVGSIITIIKTRAEKAFTEIFTKGSFSSEDFVESIRIEVNGHISGYNDDIRAFLEEIWPLMEGTMLSDIANTLSTAAANITGDQTGPALDEVVYRYVMEKISSHISSFLGGISSKITGKVHQITASAGTELKDIIRDKGNHLSEEVSKKLAEKTAGILDRYLPVKTSSKTGSEMLGNGSSGLRDTIISFSYKDYLRLFLLLKLIGGQRNDVLLRMADVIQLNVSLRHRMGSRFRMTEAYTYVEIDADLYTQPLFMSYPADFMKGKYHAVSGY